MLDLQHYTKQALNQEEQELFLKHFDKLKFKSLFSFIKQLQNMDDKLTWVKSSDYKEKLITLCNKFAHGLENQVTPVSEKIEFLENQIVISKDFPEFEWKSNSHGGICPSCGKKELFVPLQGESNFIKCSRENKCGYSSSIYGYLKKYKGLSTRDALLKLASIGGIDLNSYESSFEVHSDTKDINFRILKKSFVSNPINKEIIYSKFDSSKNTMKSIFLKH